MYLLRAVPIYPEGLAVVPPFLEGHDMVHIFGHRDLAPTSRGPGPARRGPHVRFEPQVFVTVGLPGESEHPAQLEGPAWSQKRRHRRTSRRMLLLSSTTSTAFAPSESCDVRCRSLAVARLGR